MTQIITEKTNQLSGHVKISGAKNSALPIMAASILTDQKCTLTNIPKLTDIQLMKSLLKSIGCKITSHSNKISIDASDITYTTADYELVSKMRGSFLLAGPMLAKTGHTKISLPGGCPIGSRPIDLHLKGFSALGADISQEHGYIDIYAKKLHGAKIYLDFPSVGATENIMLAASLADGETIIENAAAEPEIYDLAVFLRKLGVNISGAGSDTIHITGAKNLTSATHSVIPDRIEAGTFMCAVAITKGHAFIDNVICPHIKPISAKLSEMGVKITENDTSIEVDAGGIIAPTNIKTLPFPGFPTDMQAQFSALLSTVEGTSIIAETIFENRFLHTAELCRMGAKIKTDGRTAIIEGGTPLLGASVCATDLRGGAALVLAGLAAKGVTQIKNVEHIFRGYDDIVGKLQGLGANIYIE